MSRKRIMKLSPLVALVLVAVLMTSSGAIAAPAFGNSGQGQGGSPTTYIIVFNEGVEVDAAVADLTRAHGLGVTHVYRHALRGMAAVVPQGRLNALQADPRVAYIEADQEVHLFEQVIPTGIQRIFADENPNITINGNDDFRVDVDVAVIDTGIDFDHPDLNVVARTNCSGGSPFKQSCKDNSGDDGNGHGTHVAGTIGAIDNSIGVVGVAPGARLWAVKVLSDNGSGYLSWVIAGVDWVTARADQIEVANMSLGCECSSSALNGAISNSVAKGVVYAVAAGNSDKDASTFSPANHPDVITVSALADFDGESGSLVTDTSPYCRDDQDDTLADFSNWGNKIEVTAPGVCILSTWKDGGYNTISGTSMASPHVAGAAALLASMNKPTNKTEALAIRQTIIDTGNFNWTDDSGDGIQEPLLDVSDSTVFAPATVTGSSAPAVNVVLSTDKADYVSGTDTTAVLTAVVTDETGAAISGLADIAFSTTLDDGTGAVAVSVLFSETATAGTYTGDLDISGLADGTYTVETTVTDARGVSGSGSATFTIGPAPTEASTVSVGSITYATEGGPNNDKHLNITVALVNDLGDPVAGASVSIKLDNTTTGQSWTGTGTTGTDGTVTFSLKNAPSGCYTTTVTDVTAAGLTWDGVTPANGRCK